MIVLKDPTETVSANSTEYLANLYITIDQYLMIDEDIQDIWLYHIVGEEVVNPMIKKIVDQILEDYEDIVSKGSYDIGNCTTIRDEESSKLSDSESVQEPSIGSRLERRSRAASSKLNITQAKI